ncbi:MAG: ATP synthase subunit I [Proteobacteria bacterium]|nr:ATP synthase subunit I [Pseudomonadota bacterium]
MNPLWYAVPMWVLAGLAAGGLYFASLQWNVRWFVAGKSLPMAFAVQMLRLGAMAAVLAVVAIQRGAVPLLAMACGILAARTASLWWVRRG